jgi:hypothetical protein
VDVDASVTIVVGKRMVSVRRGFDPGLLREVLRALDEAG